ncbi:hypothetical protein Cp87MAT_0023 [Corynebacterium pseudotuberculosis]|nr:hypothetical protein CPTC_00652 [Corynebacterium pseudotuberculosis]AKC72774.1 Hypothetical protein Cp226_0022 [Corynebacterium pseudotuberculosis]ARS59545.1 Hypothetical protein CpATCC19410_0028 [Corynebacterium pseudotuberculosis]AZN18913.1 hypothetical protein CpCap1W_0023 [Corynebacterium pseudotuberculosis]AZN21016.1 Hypothetical protein CpOviAF1_0022 [Corynebacterium pseudotuberculosis]
MDKVVHFFPTWVFVRELLKKCRSFASKNQRLEIGEVNNTRVIIHSVDNSCG